MLPNNHIHNEEVRIESSIHFDMVVKVIGNINSHYNQYLQYLIPYCKYLV